MGRTADDLNNFAWVNGRKVPRAGKTQADIDLMARLRSEPWGNEVIEAAKELGVNPVTLAATAQIESNFGVTTRHQSRYGSYLGMFQMGKLAYLDALKEIKRHDPMLYEGMIQDSTTGRLNPANEAVAALGYLIYLVEGLQRQGISNPTFLDVRAAYNFGLNAGARIARADKATLMKVVVRDQHALQQNNISAEETVGNWRQIIASKIGYSAAASSVMR